MSDPSRYDYNRSNIIVGNIEGSYNAIGHGAKVIINQALSASEALEKQHALENQVLAQAVVDYVRKLHAQIPQQNQLPIQAEPYKSLLPYRLADAPLFFGRDQAKQELLKSFGNTRGRLTILHSES